ncbi:serine hydrolase [Cryptosporangium phraense]|uniref:Serine hydrolase n=1 Tax=Cryptosporangium phraense TaxID=2593070 RepID=A0A545AZS2_9ACTN|nr:serine hydrolase [Cryptosporangium phraense]TQS46833.1 serine hydrolase [Cryptosporangium phraense]
MIHLADLAIPSAPALSPDGTQVVYVLRTFDVDGDRNVDELWLAPVVGGAPRRLAEGSAPSWSPDGRRLAFLSDGQIAVLDVDGGEPEPVTDGPAGAPVWSPDGNRLAFLAPAGDAGGPLVSDGLDYQTDGSGLHGAVRPHVHVVDLDGRTVRRLTDGPDGVGSLAWSPDSTTLALTRRSGPDADLTYRTPVFLLDVDSSEARVVAFADGVASTVDWAGDDGLLVVGWAGDPRGHAHLHHVDLASKAVTDLSGELDRNVLPGGIGYPGGRPVAADGRVYFCLREHGCTHLWSVAIDGGDARPVVDGAGRVVSGLSVAGGRAAVALATPESFGEIVVVDLATGVSSAVTDRTVELHPREERWFEISDGTRVQGWIMRDRARRGPRPLLLDVHGGPHNAWNAAADDVHLYHQELVEHGWVVLVVNPRGSDGYGEEFYDGVHGAWGVADADDFLEPLDELVAEGLADPDRLAIAGYSYGGFTTCWLTGHDDRFAVAVAGGTVSDLVSISGSSDDAHFLSAFELGGLPWAEPDSYAAMSPLTRVADVRTPTLLLHGAEDRTCPVGQAQQWHTALRQQGVPARLVVYPGASHAFLLVGAPSQRLDYHRRVVDWLTKHTTAAHWQRRLAVLAARHRVPGAQLGILRGGEVIELAHGVLHSGTGAPVRTDSLFQIGSITKVWTATVAMLLVDEGLLRLDTPVAEVLPELRLSDPDVTKAVTVRHLLTHTSGIDGDVFTDTGRGDDCVEKYVEQLEGVGQNHPLGVTFSYCNSGYSLLGRVIEKITGQTWDQALRSRLFEPLGLRSTNTLPEEALLYSTAVGHQDGEPVTTWMLPRAIGPAGLINSTVADVLTFVRAHLDGGLLSAGSAAAMADHQADLPDKQVLGDSWGLGWIRFGWDGHRLIGHDGTTLGQAAFLRVLPSAGLAVVLLTNGGSARDLYQDLFREIFAEDGVSMPAPFAPGTSAEGDASAYVGTYERAGVRMEVEPTLLRTTITGPLAELEPDPVTEYPLVPAGPGVFAVRPPEAENWMPVTFYTLPTGEPYLHFGVRATPKVS